MADREVFKLLRILLVLFIVIYWFIFILSTEIKAIFFLQDIMVQSFIDCVEDKKQNKTHIKYFF